jgi:hypothetical protein
MNLRVHPKYKTKYRAANFGLGDDDGDGDDGETLAENPKSTAR